MREENRCQCFRCIALRKESAPLVLKGAIAFVIVGLGMLFGAALLLIMGGRWWHGLLATPLTFSGSVALCVAYKLYWSWKEMR